MSHTKERIAWVMQHAHGAWGYKIDHHTAENLLRMAYGAEGRPIFITDYPPTTVMLRISRSLAHDYAIRK